MAITDVLRGLLGGAGGALAGYGIQQQREQERLERETERLERQEALRRQQEQEDRRFAMQVQQAVAEGILAPTEYVEYAKPSDFLRGEAIGMQRPAADADMSSILADQPIGMQQQAPSRRSEVASALSPETRGGRMAGGAMVAPGQTYPAIDRVLAEAEPTPRAEDIGARDTERPARGLDRVLEITPEDIAGRFERAPMQGSWTGGRGTFEGLDGQMYRAVTPEERAALEDEALRRKLQLQSEIEFELINEQRTKVADELNMTGERRQRFIATGEDPLVQPRAGSQVGSLENRIDDYRRLVSTFMSKANDLGALPTKAQVSDYAMNMARVYDIPGEFSRGLLSSLYPETPPVDGGLGGDNALFGVTDGAGASGRAVPMPRDLKPVAGDFQIPVGRTPEELLNAKREELRGQIRAGGVTETQRARLFQELQNIEERLGISTLPG